MYHFSWRDPYGYHPMWDKKDDAYELSMALTGASKSEIDLKVIGNSLKISFEGNSFCDQISKSWALPDGVSNKDVSAKLEKGVLTIVVKVPELAEERIQIK